MSTAVRHLRPLASPGLDPGSSTPDHWPVPGERGPAGGRTPEVAVARGTTVPGRPVRLVVDGVAMLLSCPPPPAVREPAPCVDQPMLPLHQVQPPDRTSEGTGLDLQRAEQWVAGLAQVVCEVLGRRRPAHQLRGTLDEESLALIAAWARLGTLCPEGMGRPRLQASSPDRIEGWLAFRVHGRRLAVAVTLQHRGERWRCTGFRVLAPRALTSRAA